MIIEDETEFCGEDLLHSVLHCKVRPVARAGVENCVKGCLGFSGSFESLVGG